MPSGKQSRRTMLHVLMAVGLALIGVLPAVAAYAQADSTGDQPPPVVADDAATAVGGPTLQCNVIALRVMAPETSGARFVCHVDGAQPGDTAFTVQATADLQLAGRLAACTGALVSGVGDCVGGFVDRASTTISQFSVTATLEPSGATLGPVALGPASVTPKPLLPQAPTAPITYFPLPEP